MFRCQVCPYQIVDPLIVVAYLILVPPVASKAVVLKKNPIIGTFHTKELRSWKQVRAKTSKVVSFTHAYSTIPSLLLGLTAVDVGNGANVRVKSYTSKIQLDRFEVNLDSWEETTLYGAGCAWLEIEADDKDFQFGSYHTIEDHPWTRPQIHNTRKITFKRAFATAPHVVVWLSCIDLSSGKNWRIKTFATDVSAKGFTIHIDTWADSVLYTAVASWLAYPVDRAGVTSGSFTTLDIRSWAQPQLYNSGHEAFKSGVFEKPPKMFLALNSLDMGRGRNMRLSVKADNVSATGMTWHLDSWEDSVLYSAGASYIALR